MTTIRFFIGLGLLTLTTTAFPNEVRIVKAEAECHVQCNFRVTLEHADTGWKHYADRWQVLTPDGQLLGERVLYHPHVDEQPFTRSLGRVNIPPGIDSVIIRAHDSVHGDSADYPLKLPARRQP